MLYWDDFKAHGDLSPESDKHTEVGALCLTRDIAPGATADFTFVLAWHFPNRTPAWCGWQSGSGRETRDHRQLVRHEVQRCLDGGGASGGNLKTAGKGLGEICVGSEGIHAAPAVKDAAAANLTTLVSQTCFRTADGEFHGFEGVNDHAGAATAIARMSGTTRRPRSFCSRSSRAHCAKRLTDTRWTSAAAFTFASICRKAQAAAGSPPPTGRWARSSRPAWTGGSRATWSGCTRCGRGSRKAMEFCWVPGGWDANHDGVMEGVQHNTYDIEFYGPNPLCGIYYLGGLRAAEEMALAVGDKAFAAECRRLFESGRTVDRCQPVQRRVLRPEDPRDSSRGHRQRAYRADGRGRSRASRFPVGRRVPRGPVDRRVPGADCRPGRSARRDEHPQDARTRSGATTTTRTCLTAIRSSAPTS